MPNHMNARQAAAVEEIIAADGLRFVVEPDIDGAVIAREDADPYYEPSPVRYRIARDGTAQPLDRDGYVIYDDDEN